MKSDSITADNQIIVMIDAKGDITDKANQIAEWFRIRLNNDNVIVINKPTNDAIPSRH